MSYASYELSLEETKRLGEEYSPEPTGRASIRLLGGDMAMILVPHENHISTIHVRRKEEGE